MKILKLLLAVLLLITALSCNKNKDGITDPSLTKGGAISLKMLKSTIPPEVKVILAKLERFEFPTIVDSVIITSSSDTVKLTMKNIPIGNWKLSVFAKDSLYIIRYSGTTNVTIFEDVTTTAYVTMFPSGSGTGNLEIYVVWSTAKWKMSPNNPILKQTPGTWDEEHYYVKGGKIVKVGSEYKMWYISGDNNIQRIAYATSLDGISWVKHGIVISNGPSGSWIDRGVAWPTVLLENGVYKMWFNGKSFTNLHNGIGYATSSDGKNWSLHPTPVIATDSDKPSIFTPSIVNKNGTYYLYYTVESPKGASTKIYLATSTDGINWVDQGMVLEGRPTIPWEKGGVFCASVMYESNKFIMYYTAKSNPTYFDMGYIGKAESVNGKNWTFSSEQPELTNLNTLPWKTRLVAYPFVFKDNNKLKMYFAAISDLDGMYKIGYAEQ